MAKILIIDDDRDFLESIKIMLKKDGHEVEAKYDAKDVIAKIKGTSPDLVILDVIFPENESAGFDIAREMRDPASGVADIPVLMLTAINRKFPLGFSKNDMDSDWLPVTEFLEKPIDFELLRNKIQELLQK